MTPPPLGPGESSQISKEIQPERQTAQRVRVPVTLVVLFLGTALLVLGGLWAGSATLSAADIIRAVFGEGKASAVFVVQQLRLPRVVTAVCVGVALAISGLLMQGLLRNPLGSPDILGVNALAGFGAVCAISLGLSAVYVSACAAVGALVAALAMNWVALSQRLGTARLILVGIGLGAVGSAATTLVLTRISYTRLGQAQVWLSGSLHATDYTDVRLSAIGALCGVLCGGLLVRSLGQLELGDTTATATGLSVRVVRLGVLTVSAVSAGAAVSVAGPIAFVALGAPHLARRLVGPTSVASLCATALIGACIVMAADQLGQVIMPTVDIAAGVVTAAVGAPYLLWILHRAKR